MFARGPKIETDGLVLYLDAANKKSLEGEPTTNLVLNPLPDTVWSVGNYQTSTVTATIEYENNKPFMRLSGVTNDLDYPRIQGPLWTNTFTGDYTVSMDVRGTDGAQLNFRMYSAGSTKITHLITLTSDWVRVVFTGNTTFEIDRPYFNPLTTGATYDIRDIQVETKTYATPFVNGTRDAWKDLSKNGNDGVIFNNPTFSSNNKGSLVFNGTNDFSDITIPQLIGLDTITVECWANWVSGNGDMFFGFNSYCVYTSGGALGYNNGASNNIGISQAKVTELGLKGSFHHYTFIMNSSGLLSENKIYIDCVEYPLTVQSGADGNTKSFTDTLTLCNWNAEGPSWYANIMYGNIRVYNKPLSLNTITGNYNATKSRYGL
jgi:hypothetical protein